MIRITARKLKLGEGFIDFMKKTLKKRMKKFMAKKGYPEIIINKNGASFTAEINFYYKKTNLLATSTAENAKKAFIGAMEKLKIQLQKTHEKKCDYALG
ncbi:MAG: HPF/RaiA family ribosome-associated protein [Alphaproteobacteria bacterium]